MCNVQIMTGWNKTIIFDNSFIFFFIFGNDECYNYCLNSLPSRNIDHSLQETCKSQYWKWTDLELDVMHQFYWWLGAYAKPFVCAQVRMRVHFSVNEQNIHTSCLAQFLSNNNG